MNNGLFAFSSRLLRSWAVIATGVVLMAAVAATVAQQQPSDKPAPDAPADARQASDSPPAQGSDTEGADQATQPSTTGPGGNDDGREQGQQAAGKRTAEEVIRELLMKSPTVTSPTVPGTTVASSDDLPPEIPSMEATAVRIGRGKLLPEGHFLADRIGRIVHEGDDIMLAFVADEQGMADPPIRLLPNRALEEMQKYASAGSSVRFKVSGEITLYRGKNYLLVRKYLIASESSNFR